ncbi:hypothetical protein CP082626L3_1066A, partial [Chlamydia psittaci 08-2626_L3]
MRNNLSTAARISSGDFATMTPPFFPLPPACTCTLTTPALIPNSLSACLPSSTDE